MEECTALPGNKDLLGFQSGQAKVMLLGPSFWLSPHTQPRVLPCLLMAILACWTASQGEGISPSLQMSWLRTVAYAVLPELLRHLLSMLLVELQCAGGLWAEDGVGQRPAALTYNHNKTNREWVKNGYATSGSGSVIDGWRFHNEKCQKQINTIFMSYSINVSDVQYREFV